MGMGMGTDLPADEGIIEGVDLGGNEGATPVHFTPKLSDVLLWGTEE